MALGVPGSNLTTVFKWILSFFFFQAEDGIRDVAVTGVQTCALPIFQQQNLLNEQQVNLNNIFKRPAETNFSVPDTIIIQTKPEYDIAGQNLEKKIGRASCRERV